MTGTPLRIVIPGGSGQVGRLLARHFCAQGHTVTILTRRPGENKLWREVGWDGRTRGPWVAELDGADVCINLAGRSVNCRYHARNRQEIYDSRIVPTRLLNEVIAGLKTPPRIWMNSSTATIYRHSLSKQMDEATGELGGDGLDGEEPGAPDTWNFSIRVAKGWEQAFFETAIPGTRKAALRSAVTFSADKGGIFDVLSTLARRGLGGTNGSGEQMVSWVHGQDFCRAVDFLIAEGSMSGVVNVASPNPLPNAQFMRALRQAWGVPLGLPAPAWLIEIGCFLLQTESELVLKSRNVVPGRLEAAGFRFLFTDWPEAARDLVTQWRSKSL